VQTTQSRDIGILALVIGLFVILFIVTVVVGPPATFG
jgi:tetrahydromethanopterin S-methyltransferase subunit G